MPSPEFEELRELLRETMIIQNQQAKVLLNHSEMLAEHERRMAAFDEQMGRIGRHLEVLSDIADGLIRDTADRKKRRS